MTPQACSKAAWRVVDAQPIDGKRLSVRFVDGTSGIVDLGQFLAAESIDGSPFAALREETFFQQAKAVNGSVQWPNGADLAPDAMHDAILATGCWVVPEHVTP